MTTLHGRVVLPDRVLSPGVVRIEGDRIVEVTAGGDPATDRWIVPGLVDIHVHGGGGGCFDGGPDEARRAAAYHLHHGTTSAVASLVTAEPPDLLAQTAQLAALGADGTLAGIHLEGPFLAPARCGAHDPALLRAPDRVLLEQLLDAGRGHVRQVTLAPELPGAADLVAHLRTRGVVAAVGHTDGSYAEAAAAFAAGAGLATHLFNAMPPLHHRAPGPVAAALAAPGVVCEAIADGMHLDDATVTMLFAMIGADRIALVTDAMAAAGQPDGHYRLGRREVEVSGGVAQIDGVLAGGTATLAAIVRRVVATGVSVVDATRAATLTPARAVGLDSEVGALTVGRRADLLVLDSDLEPVAVMRRGQWVRGSAVVRGSWPPGPR